MLLAHSHRQASCMSLSLDDEQKVPRASPWQGLGIYSPTLRKKQNTKHLETHIRAG